MSAEDKSLDSQSPEDQVKDHKDEVGSDEPMDLDTSTAETEAEASDTDSEGDTTDSGYQDEVNSLKEQMLRMQAEMQNLRRRTEKDIQNAHKFGQEKLIKELLPILDNFDRAIEAAPEGEENPVLEGVRMTQGLLSSALEKFNVVAVDPMGEPFDPQLHQAMSMVENPLVEPNTVIAVMQKGYTLSGRLLRPAMVMVSKGGTVEPVSGIDEKA